MLQELTIMLQNFKNFASSAEASSPRSSSSLFQNPFAGLFAGSPKNGALTGNNDSKKNFSAAAAGASYPIHAVCEVGADGRIFLGVAFLPVLPFLSLVIVQKIDEDN